VSGQLNEREATRLNNQQEHINKIEYRAKADGVVTMKERARVTHAQNQASQHIAILPDENMIARGRGVPRHDCDPKVEM